MKGPMGTLAQLSKLASLGSRACISGVPGVNMHKIEERCIALEQAAFCSDSKCACGEGLPSYSKHRYRHQYSWETA